MIFDDKRSENIAKIIAIVIGGTFAILHPEQMEDAFKNTIWALVLIHLFW